MNISLHKRSGLLGGAILLLLLALLLLFVRDEQRSSQHRKPAKSRKEEFEVGIPAAREIQSFLSVYGDRLEAMERQLVALKDDGRSLRSEWERKTAEPVPEPAPESEPPPPAAPEPSRLRRIALEETTSTRRTTHIPAGSFAEATLLTGVYAPVQGEALPVLLRLDAALVGPGRARVPLRQAFVVGKAQGDANSERAVIQLETLSHVTDGGKSVESAINGWVVDDDGVQGLRGSYVWRASEIVALASLSGAAAGASESLAARETTTLTSPAGAETALTGDPLRFTGYRALNGTLTRISEIISHRMEEITPAIHVANGKRVTIALISGATLSSLPLEELSDESQNRPYVGLDLDR